MKSHPVIEIQKLKPIKDAPPNVATNQKTRQGLKRIDRIGHSGPSNEVATNQKTRQGLKQLRSEHAPHELFVATNQKTRQGLKLAMISDDGCIEYGRCNEPENPTGIETLRASSKPGSDMLLQRTRKPDRD